MRGPNNAMGSESSGPMSPGKRHQYGMPPPPVSIYTLTGWADPE